MFLQELSGLPVNAAGSLCSVGHIYILIQIEATARPLVPAGHTNHLHLHEVTRGHVTPRLRGLGLETETTKDALLLLYTLSDYCSETVLRSAMMTAGQCW